MDRAFKVLINSDGARSVGLKLRTELLVCKKETLSWTRVTRNAGLSSRVFYLWWPRFARSFGTLAALNGGNTVQTLDSAELEFRP